MRLLLLFITALFLLQSCYTTHDVFIQNPVPTDKMTNEVGINTNFAFGGLPHSIGVNFQGNTQELGLSSIRLNYFLRTQNYFRGALLETGFDKGAIWDNVNSAKFVLMPSFPMGDKSFFGVGVGLNYLYDSKNQFQNYGVSMGAAIVSLNYTFVTRKEEDRIRYFNMGLNLSNRFIPLNGVSYYRSEYIDNYAPDGPDTIISNSYYDSHDFGVSSSFKISFVGERLISGSNLWLVSKFDIGVAYYGDIFNINSTYARSIHPASENVYYDRTGGFVNFPIGFTIGLKF